MTDNTLKHDEKGFLVNPYASNSKGFSWIHLQQISKDIRAIRLLLERYTKTGNLVIPVNEITTTKQTSAGGKAKATNGNKPKDASSIVTVTRKKPPVDAINTRTPTSKSKKLTPEVKVRVKIKIDSKSVDPAKVRVKHNRSNGSGVTEKGASDPAKPSPITPKVRPRPAAKELLAKKTKSDTPKQTKERRAPVDAIPSDRNKARRGADGRFSGDGAEDESALGTAINSLTGAIGSLAIGGEDIDPTIKATKEVFGVAKMVTAPIAGVTRFLFSRNQNRETLPWYRRIWQQMRRQQADSEKWNRKQLERLKGIEEKPTEKGNGNLILMAVLALATLLKGFGSTVAGIIAKTLGRTALGGLIAKALPAILAGRSRNAGSGFPSGNRSKRTSNLPNEPNTPDLLSSSKSEAKKESRLSRTGGRAKSVLGKIPLIGSLLGLGFLANDVMGAEGDESLSRAQKNTEIGGAVGTFTGGLGGAAIGAAIGTAILPGIGTAIGAAAGAFFGGEAGNIVGAKLGEWVTGLGSPEQIVNSLLAQFNQWIAELSASDVGTFLKNSWSESIKWLETTANSVNDFFKNNLGVDPKAAAETAANTVNEAAQTVVDKVNAAKETVANAGKQVGDAARAAVERGWEATKNFVGVGDKPSPVPAVPLVLKSAANMGSSAVDAVSKVVTGRKKSTNSNWQAAKGELVDASNKAGVDAGTVAAIANFESGFSSTAQPIAKGKRAHMNKVRQFDGTMAISSAHGYGQFIDDSWAGMLKAHGAKYGLADTASMQRNSKGKFTDESMAIADKYRNDKRIQAAMLAEYTRENVERGKQLGGKDDLANVYALHNLGGGDGADFLKALSSTPNAKVSTVLKSGVISGNGSLYKDGSITVAEAYANMGSKMREGESYTQEARDLQKGIVTPTQQTTLAPKPETNQEKIAVNDAMPDLVKQVRVKDSSGKTRTIADMGISNYSDLQAKGGQAFEGGKNDPATLYAAALVQQELGDNFDRVTAQNDRYRNEKSPRSGHTKGNKFDFTVKNISYAEANKRTKALMAKHGLQEGVDFSTIDEAANPSAKATGAHIDMRLTESGQAKMQATMAAKSLAATPKAPSTPALANTGPSRIPLLAAANLRAPVAVSTSAIKPPELPKSAYKMQPAISVEAPRPPPESASKSVVVNVPEQSIEPTRDVSDRAIAHIATAGISRGLR